MKWQIAKAGISRSIEYIKEQRALTTSQGEHIDETTRVVTSCACTYFENEELTRSNVIYSCAFETAPEYVTDPGELFQ